MRITRTGLALAVGVVFGGVMIPVVTAVGHRPHHGGSERGGNTFSARLVGYQEVPSKSSIARGTFQARWDEGAQVLRYTLSYADLEAPALFAHIHFGQRHTNGDISAFLCGGGTKPAPCPSPSGTVTGEIREADVVGPAAQGIDGLPPGPAKLIELIAAIRARAAYANVHSTKFPSGEIRGQIRGGKGRSQDR